MIYKWPGPTNVDVDHNWWGGGGCQKLTTVLFVREMFDNFGWPLNKYDVSIPQTFLFSIHNILEMGCGTP